MDVIILNSPRGDWLHVFGMPLPGYGGCLPFTLELAAMYHLVTGKKGGDYLRLGE